MRPEEELVKEIIIQHIKSSEDKDAYAINGEDPPDYYLSNNGKKIALEVTNAEDVFLNDEGEIEHARRGLDTSISKYIRTLREKYDGHIPNNDSIIIFFEGPFTDFHKFKKHLDGYIDDICKFNKQADDEIKLFGGKIKLKRISNNVNKIVGIIGVKSNRFSGNIEKHAEVILKKIIETKERKIDGSSVDEKWIGILNNCVLANIDTFRRVFKRIEVKHDFKRIYIVDHEGSIRDVLN
ncbi:hypothetical protein [Paenibacillus sp. 1P07SE]|uniref:hypothetical protein n=1 Tax=Paenibacillus sp. 1P07SE TaxID=3132209 RepID=UPI0039A54B70